MATNAKAKVTAKASKAANETVSETAINAATETETKANETSTVSTDDSGTPSDSNTRYAHFDEIGEMIDAAMEGASEEDSRQAKMTVAMFGNDKFFSPSAILALYSGEAKVRTEKRETLMGMISKAYEDKLAKVKQLQTMLKSIAVDQLKAHETRIELLKANIRAANVMFDRAAKTVWFIKHHYVGPFVELDSETERLLVVYHSKTIGEGDKARQITERFASSGAKLFKEADDAIGKETNRAPRNRVTPKSSDTSTAETRGVAATAIADIITKFDKPLSDLDNDKEREGYEKVMAATFKASFVADDTLDFDAFVDWLKAIGVKLTNVRVKLNNAAKKAA